MCSILSNRDLGLCLLQYDSGHFRQREKLNNSYDFIKILEHLSTPKGSFVDSMDHLKKCFYKTVVMERLLNLPLFTPNALFVGTHENCWSIFFLKRGNV